MKWRPENTPLLMLSLILIGLGLLAMLLQGPSPEPLPQSTIAFQSLTSVVLIVAGISVLAIGWRRR